MKYILLAILSLSSINVFAEADSLKGVNNTLSILKQFDELKVIRVIEDWPKSFTNQFKVRVRENIANKKDHVAYIKTIPKEFFGDLKTGETIVVGDWFVTSIDHKDQKTPSNWSQIIACKKGSDLMYCVVNW